MNTLKFYKCLSDDTRLKSVMMIFNIGEACVCDLMRALELDQPKTSRHLAELRKCGILLDERRGKWVFYKIHPELPSWAKQVITATAKENVDYYQVPLDKLKQAVADNENGC